MDPIGMRFDVGIRDPELVDIGTKDLNKLLKDKGIDRVRKEAIKRRRRTLKNR